MTNLYRANLKLSLKRKESFILWAFALLPFILIIVDLFDTQFMQLSAPVNSLSFTTFLEAVINIQYETFLPLVALIYLVIVTVGDEVRSGKLLLYKDINRAEIIFAKLFSLLTVYGIYFGLTVVTSLLTYYTHLVNQPYTSGQFFPNEGQEFKNSVLIVLATIAMSVICIFLTAFLSLKFNNGLTLLLVSIVMLFSFVSSKLTLTSYIFPNAYPEFFTGSNFWLVLLAILGNLVGISFILSWCNQASFKKIEY